MLDRVIVLKLLPCLYINDLEEKENIRDNGKYMNNERVS